jgi:hypothetical protein
MKNLCWIVLIVFILLCLGTGHFSKPEQKQIQQQDAKINVRMLDGKNIVPVRVYARRDHVQLIMPDDSAIVMAWDQIDFISYK